MSNMKKTAQAMSAKRQPAPAFIFLKSVAIVTGGQLGGTKERLMRTYMNMIDVGQYLRESHEQLLEWQRTGEGPQWFRRGGKIWYHYLDVKAFRDSPVEESNAQSS